MLAAGINQFNFLYTNVGAPSTTPGTSVIPGASNAEGDWTEIASESNITKDIYYIVLVVQTGFTNGAQKDHLLDIGIDPAGGTSYTPIISNIACGASPDPTRGSRSFQFYYWIPANTAVAVRVQGNNATAGTVRVTAYFYGAPSRPEFVRVGQYSETIGAITNSSGVSFTPGNSGAEGSWASLGTTTRALWQWQLCLQLSAAAFGNQALVFDFATGDGSNKHIIQENLYVRLDSSEIFIPATTTPLNFFEIPAGGELFVRGSSSGTADSGWNAVAVGIGG